MLNSVIEGLLKTTLYIRSMKFKFKRKVCLSEMSVSLSTSVPFQYFAQRSLNKQPNRNYWRNYVPMQRRNYIVNHYVGRFVREKAM